MPISDSVFLIIIVVFVLALSVCLGYAVLVLINSLDYHTQFKSLCKGLDNIITSHTVSKNFDNTMAELEKIILTIIKPNKNFPQACRTVGGLLQQYIYWLNTGRAVPFSKELDLATIKGTAHDLIKLYHTNSFTSDADLYDEALLNSISKSIDKKDFDSAKNKMAELDVQITKKQKKYTFIETGLPLLCTLLGTALGAVLSTVVSKMLGG